MLNFGIEIFMFYNFFGIGFAGLLHEMLGSTKTGDSKAWKVRSQIIYFLFFSEFLWFYKFQVVYWLSWPQVLIMDKVTVKVMSHSCKMADITDQGISCKHIIIFIVSSICNFKSLFFFWFIIYRMDRENLNIFFYL